MSHEIDARGLACPQPVLLTMEAMKSAEGSQLEVVVDNEASKENVVRAVKSQNWEVVSLKEQGPDFRIAIKRP
ncbi:MAG: sulfurtransferase TusA family protein [Desulfonatronovibrionaceae bacterium]